MILPQAQDRPIVVFHVWPSLLYGTRLVAAFALLITGLGVQLATTSVFPGVLLIALGNLVLLVRGYDNRVDQASFDPAAEWERVDISRLDDLKKLHREMRRWDVNALDVTNIGGGILFVGIAIAMGIVAVMLHGPLSILVIDAMVIFLPHWLTGTRSILTLPNLMVRVDLIQYLLRRFERRLANHRVHLLTLLRGGQTKIPDDVKFKVDIQDHHRDFLGLCGQVVINEVNGTSYPYFYVVLVGRKGYFKGTDLKQYTAPHKMTKEFKVQDQVDVVVLRQTTTKTSGYHTNPAHALKIFHEGLRLAESVSTKENPSAA